MATKKPCVHRRRAVVKVEAVKVKLAADGTVVAWGDTPDMDKWAVLEDHRCSKCGHVEMRFARKGFGESTARKALSRYGVRGTALPPPPNYKPKAEPVFVPLTSWPFPVSAHAESA